MSYFERLNAIKGQLQSKNDALQDTQDNISTSGEELLSAKINDVAEKMEAVGGGGTLIIQAGKQVKKLYDKYRGKKDEKDEPEEGEEGEGEEGVGGEAEPEMIENPALFTESGDLDLSPEGLAQPMTIPNPALPEQADETPIEAPAEQPPVENMSNTAQLVENAPEGMETTTQSNIMDFDPEDAITSLNSGATTGSSVADVTDGVTDAVTSNLIDAGVDAGSSLLDTGLAIADVALDAIPVVGEIALIGTAIAGFFEGLFGDKPKVPDTEIVGDSGIDASAIVKQTATALQV